ncbi:hypothetical protein DL96DRAFT_1631346 [Flagelloscypha sp. PMI_526]|nr:hypothetical protein DL96DRAFT_1631346 [Flagelloscypha sp. PMI_526]
MELVRISVLQNTLRVLDIWQEALAGDVKINHPLSYSAPMLKVCAATLTTFRFGYQLVDQFMSNLLSKNDLHDLDFSVLTSLETLQFVVLPDVFRYYDQGPATFLEWLTAEIEGMVKSQGPSHAFSYLKCDFDASAKARAATVTRILTETDGWLGLDHVLARESIRLIVRSGPQYLDECESQKSSLFPTCFTNGLMELRVLNYRLGGMFGIDNAIYYS